MAVLSKPEAFSPNKALALRFPGFGIRLARCSDMRRMARIATRVFRDEHDASGFDKYRKLSDQGPPGKPTLRERLFKKEQDWRHIQLLINRTRPGRRFLLATYMKQPADYMTTDNASAAREKILGWAEFQDPTHTAHTPVREPIDAQKNASLLGPTFARLEGIFKSMTMTFGSRTVVIPPNSELVHLPVVLESFNRALLDDTDEWKYWCKHFIPTFFGRNGDPEGRQLVLRSLVVNTEHWGHGIDRRLLEWGLARAASNSWDVLTLAPSVINPWTLDTLEASGFKEAGTLDIFWSSHTAFLWKPNPKIQKEYAGVATDIEARPKVRDADADADDSASIAAPTTPVTSRNPRRRQLVSRKSQQHHVPQSVLSPPSSPPLLAAKLRVSRKLFTTESSKKSPSFQAAHLPASKWFTTTKRKSPSSEPEPQQEQEQEQEEHRNRPAKQRRVTSTVEKKQANPDVMVSWYKAWKSKSPSPEPEPRTAGCWEQPMAAAN